MNAFLAILWAKLHITRHTIASIRKESRLKVSVVTSAAVLLWVGACVLAFSALQFLNRQFQDVLGGAVSFSIADIIMPRLLAVFALALFLMLIFSNVLIAFSTLYRSREVAYLIQSPTRFQTYFLARFVECVFLSSWASAYLGSPLILAYGMVNGAPWNFFLAAAAFYVPFVTVPAALGAIVALVLTRVFPRVQMGTMVTLGAGVIVLLFLYIRDSLAVEHLADDTMMRQVLDSAAQTQSHYLPSFWAAQGVLSAGAGAWGDSAFYFLTLLSTALVSVWFASALAQRIFYPGWSYLVGQDRQRVHPMGRGPFGLAERFLRGFATPTIALTMKDIKLFCRDVTQWSQFVIFFGLMALYIANLQPDSAALTGNIWHSLVISLNIGACTLILATLTSRFVFPLISLEGRRFWILGLAPLSFRQLIWQKFWLSVCTTSAFTVGLTILSCIKLEVDALAFFLSMYTIIITNLTLSGLAIGLGSLYPNFQEDNPARIVSGMGGTLNFLLSMAYITLVVGAQTVLLQWHILGRFTSTAAFWYSVMGILVFISALSIISCLVPLHLGLRNLRKMEF
jgi:ABC-2 type transport system permease protein